MLDSIKGIFDYKHSFYEFMRKIGWVFLTSIIFFVTSIPVFTIGASLTAMYAVFFKLVQEREISLFKDYFGAFKKAFVRSIPVWILCLIVGAICYVDIAFFVGALKTFGTLGYVMLGIAIIITFVVLFFAIMIFPIMAEFESNISDTFTLMRFIAKRHCKKCIWATVATIIIMGFAIWIIIKRAYLFIYFPVLSVGLNSLVLTYIYDSILRPYYEEDEELDEELERK